MVTNVAIKADNTQMKRQFHTAQRRLRIQAMLAFFAFLAAVFVSPGNRAAIAQGYGVTLAQLNTRLKVVEAKTQFQSADATTQTTTFSTCNVLVQNGLGAKNGNPADPIFGPSAVNGLGNLILGYNTTGRTAFFGGTDVRTGSHNLIVGNQNNYSSYDGIVVGRDNTISAPYACASGGFANTANGDFACVSGGQFNTASASSAVISGGTDNQTFGQASSISGGSDNKAYNYASSISGGFLVTINRFYGLGCRGHRRGCLPQPLIDHSVHITKCASEPR